MTVCPKCSYALVLLPKRRRYKCAKCSSLYLEKFIDSREFRRFNQIQRDLTREEAEIESKRRFEEAWNACKLVNKPQRQKLIEEEKKQKRKEYYQKTKERILRHAKEYYQKNKEKVFEKNRTWAQNNIEKARKISLEY